MTNNFLTRLKPVNSYLNLQRVKTLQLFSVRIRFNFAIDSVSDSDSYSHSESDFSVYEFSHPCLFNFVFTLF